MPVEPIAFLLGLGSRPIPLVPGSVVTLGRDAQNTIPIDDALASRQHACIHCENNSVLVSDMGSRNGTFVNDQRVNGAERVALRSDDRIRIGGKVLHFVSTQAGMEPRKAAQKWAAQCAQMQTIDNAVYFKDGKVVTQSAPKTATVPVTPEHTQPVGEDTTSAALSGSLEGGCLPQIMQYIHTAALTGALRVLGKRNGSILFLNGQLHAATNGAQAGVDAVYGCARETEGKFAFERFEPAQIESVPKTITLGTINVIFECCRQMDESNK
ncbi:MAG TPA: FHA domain-containing protein [Planctomycetota bacterium]|jgi:hypothetical protein